MEKRKEPQTRTSLLYQQARRYHQAGDLGEAVPLYAKVLVARPRHTPSLLHLAEIAWRTGNLDQAVVLLQRALTIDPQYAEAYEVFWQVRKAQQQYGSAELLLRRLPFELTAGQREVLEVISRELAATRPMNRLLQGEVGSGKTIVAVLAMLQMVDAGYQCALLAPTEVLAAQHLRSIRDVLGPLGMAGQLGGMDDATRVALLSRREQSAPDRAARVFGPAMPSATRPTLRW